MRTVVVMLGVLLAACRSATPETKPDPKPEAKTTVSTTNDEVTITEASQREAAVGKSVVVIGVQTRTKQPQVNGVDVDGDYELSDKKVVARGVLEKTVVPELPPARDGLEEARRGAGTYYAVIDPKTKMLAKTKLAE